MEEQRKLRLFTLNILNGYGFLWKIILYILYSIKHPLIYELTTNYVLIKEKKKWYVHDNNDNIEKYFYILLNNTLNQHWKPWKYIWALEIAYNGL